MVPLYEGDLYLVHELDVDYDFNSDNYFIAKLTIEEANYILTKYNKKRHRADLELLLIRDQEVYTYERTCKELGIKPK